MSETLLHLATASFEAARRLAELPEGHPARRLHGHGFRVQASASLPAEWAPDRLGETLRAAVAPLDYADLNERLPVPGDLELARWIVQQLAVPGRARLALRSAPERGVALDDAGPARIWRRFRFEAAHRLPQVPPGHPCGRMHGHGFSVTLHVDPGTVADDALVIGDRLAAHWAPLGARLHQTCLNALPGLDNPTSERIADWIWRHLAPAVPALSWVEVRETATAGCRYDGVQYRIWKEQRFESALRLPDAPAGDARRGLHGHSYRLRLQLGAPLDRVLGWVVDFGDVKTLFAPIYAALDHRRLDALPALDSAAPAALARWIRDQAAPRLPWLERIDLYPTPDAGVSLRWGGAAAADGL